MDGANTWIKLRMAEHFEVSLGLVGVHYRDAAMHLAKYAYWCGSMNIPVDIQHSQNGVNFHFQNDADRLTFVLHWGQILSEAPSDGSYRKGISLPCQ